MSIERIIGKLEQSHASIHADLKEIKKQVSNLQRFQWKQAGAYAAISAIMGVAASLCCAAIASIH